ncbi:hypothetical protein HNP46_000426 [Pseudomonas nitritireducens]|uniref:Uncharacterized protein n=1 Tax=Pseudomonas nitroreducens TaxID=46680 RepID=A0A7W7KFN7_PSENT|nr:hypothetical protein [Pseudomonas nitritireducens]MBB4861615.1 hypothetical protein [Pseudomonas nitritireducens]
MVKISLRKCATAAALTVSAVIGLSLLSWNLSQDDEIQQTVIHALRMVDSNSIPKGVPIKLRNNGSMEIVHHSVLKMTITDNVDCLKTAKELLGKKRQAYLDGIELTQKGLDQFCTSSGEHVFVIPSRWPNQ